ncbi:hypothetical protein HOC99_03565 [Candidatus Woesearchaeota archaeon]|jgi:hypothetical protein|nr:hypothetical protein [Candidatus Woesearchaeota archaeon]MBT4387649.1 hypothetical protein [Candidatus Woesearchaeota archaeon]MBT4595988.1 hypothetical protein [Candidatus Woesearchaeota archaeon]MBT5741177.1 hypothetical protein [Candidatus Woesearchaeota archaeon]MBT7296747.1 hypothetical protein [Candidatus Woesearchaeota archaeon]
MEFNELKLLLFEPKKFFKLKKNESSHFTILLNLFIFVIINSILYNLLEIFTSNKYGFNPFIFIIFIIIMIIFILIFSIIQTLFSSYLESAFNHLFVMLFKTKYTFLETFKPTTYSKIVTILYTIILLPFIYMIKPFIESKQFNNTFFILITLIFIILISTLIHSFYVKAIGISHYHKLSFAKSLWSAILGNLCILVITLGLLFLIGMIFVIIFGSKIPNVIF